MHYNILKILIYIVQQNASYPQMYPQKILLPIFALLMAWPLHNIRGDFRQGERAFFEVAPCCHHRNQQPTCLNTRGPESTSGPASNTLPKEMALGVMLHGVHSVLPFSVPLPSRSCIMRSPCPPCVQVLRLR